MLTPYSLSARKTDIRVFCWLIFEKIFVKNRFFGGCMGGHSALNGWKGVSLLWPGLWYWQYSTVQYYFGYTVLYCTAALKFSYWISILKIIFSTLSTEMKKSSTVAVFSILKSWIFLPAATRNLSARVELTDRSKTCQSKTLLHII